MSLENQEDEAKANRAAGDDAAAVEEAVDDAERWLLTLPSALLRVPV